MRTHLLSLPRGSLFAGCLALHIATLLVPLVAQAQSTGTVTGVVVDAQTSTPLKAATARLRDPADSTAKPLGDVSGENGSFSIERVPLGGKYTLEIHFVGYETHVVENVVVTADKPALNAGRILLKQLSIDMNEVRVTEQRPHVKVLADKTVYSVEDNPSYTATNVSELLGQIPSVEVDQDGKVSLRGEANVTIMMNDRPLTMPADQRSKFLQSLSASMVKDIEIQTNPGAQFDAKDRGGIINIVTRRTMSDMFGGNVNVGGDSHPGVNGSGGLYYNGKELNASVGGGIYRNTGEGVSTGLRLNYLDSIERRDESSGISESPSSSYSAYGQTDYKFTESDLASFSFNLNQWASNYSSHSVHTLYNVNDVVVGRLYDTNAPSGSTNNSGGYNSTSLLVRHTFGENHKLSLNGSYNWNGYTSGTSYNSTYVRANGESDPSRSTQRLIALDRLTSTLIVSLDYENAVSDDLSLSFGAKNQMDRLDYSTSTSNRDRTTGTFVVDTIQSNHYLPDNTIYAMYGSAAYKLSDALSIQAGLRAEHANISAQYISGEPIISRDYLNVFPSGSLAYNLTEQQSLTFSYRRSIALPDIDALNPKKVIWNDFSEYSGNPDLEPEFTHTLELSYNTFWEGGNMFTVTPYYSATNGSIESSQQIVNGVTWSRTTNFNGTYTIGSEISIGMRPFPWLNFRASGDVYRLVNRGSEIPGDIYSTASGYRGNSWITVDPLEGLTVGMNLSFSAPAATGASRRGGHTFWNFSLRQRLLDKKLTISLRFNDPFDMQKWEHVYDSPQLHTESTNKWSSRSIGLSLSYMFGTTPRLETHKQDKTETKGGSGSGSPGAGGQ